MFVIIVKKKDEFCISLVDKVVCCGLLRDEKKNNTFNKRAQNNHDANAKNVPSRSQSVQQCLNLVFLFLIEIHSFPRVSYLCAKRVDDFAHY